MKKVVAGLQIIFSMIGKMVPMFKIIFSFEKNMVAGIKNIFCILQAIFSMSETSVAASKKICRLPEKIDAARVIGDGISGDFIIGFPSQNLAFNR